MTQDCQPGLVFNETISACDWPEAVPECAGHASKSAPKAPPMSSSEANEDKECQGKPDNQYIA